MSCPKTQNFKPLIWRLYPCLFVVRENLWRRRVGEPNFGHVVLILTFLFTLSLDASWHRNCKRPKKHFLAPLKRPATLRRPRTDLTPSWKMLSSTWRRFVWFPAQTLFFLFPYLSNRALFPYLSEISSKHERDWENSRQLRKPETQSKVCITFVCSPTPRVLRWDYVNTEKVPLLW